MEPHDRDITNVSSKGTGFLERMNQSNEDSPTYVSAPPWSLQRPTGSLAGRWHKVPPTGPILAPLTLPVWAIEPWFGIGFHCAQLSSVLRVLLYYNLGRVTRHAWLGPRTAVRAKLTNTD